MSLRLQVFAVMKVMINNIKNMDEMKWGQFFLKTKNGRQIKYL